MNDLRDFSRCWAPISPVMRQRTIEKRSDPDASNRCRRPGYRKVAGHMYCASHFPLWETHHRILERIRSIPDRDIV